MSIVLTESGEILNAQILEINEWDFIFANLDRPADDAEVSLSNDLAVVMEVINAGWTPEEYMEAPEDEREYSDAPFNNVANHVEDLSDVEAIRALQKKVDGALLEDAIANYKRKHA